MKKLRILVLSNVAWDTTNSYGNTLSNWFEGWDDAVFYNIYSRSTLPCNHICEQYYTVPPLQLIKNLLRPSMTGHCYRYDQNICIESTQETSLIHNAQRRNKKWMYFLSDIVYSTGIWKNSKYEKFIKDANPDIVFSFGIADSFIYENYCYIKQNTKAKIVTFVADDVYGAYIGCKSIRSSLQAKRFRKMIGMSDYLYGASKELCEAYQNIFNKRFIPLYKGCISLPQKTRHINDPIKIVYAGNLLWGRDDVLATLASALEEINLDGIKAIMQIYTGSNVTPEIATKLNRGKSCQICGKLAYNEILKIQNEADILLQVESFERTQIEIVKYSFSTKIIDSLQSGGVMLVIGPQGIASVEYSRNIPGVIVIDDLNELLGALNSIIQNKQELIGRAHDIRSFALTNHSIDKIRDMLKNDFIKILSK